MSAVVHGRAHVVQDLYTQGDSPAKINERSLVYEDPGVALCEICGDNASAAPASQGSTTSSQPSESVANKDVDTSQAPISAPATQTVAASETSASQTSPEAADTSVPAASSPSEPTQSAPQGTAGSANIPTQAVPVHTKCQMKKRHIARRF